MESDIYAASIQCRVQSPSLLQVSPRASIFLVEAQLGDFWVRQLNKSVRFGIFDSPHDIFTIDLLQGVFKHTSSVEPSNSKIAKLASASAIFSSANLPHFWKVKVTTPSFPIPFFRKVSDDYHQTFPLSKPLGDIFCLTKEKSLFVIPYNALLDD